MQIQSLSQPSLKTQLRALFVIARKDWKVFWRYPLNAVSSIFQPIIWITPVYFMGKAFSTNGQALGFAAYSGTGDYMSFILLGTVLTNYILTVFWGMGYALKEDMDAGVLEVKLADPCFTFAHPNRADPYQPAYNDHHIIDHACHCRCIIRL